MCHDSKGKCPAITRLVDHRLSKRASSLGSRP